MTEDVENKKCTIKKKRKKNILFTLCLTYIKMLSILSEKRKLIIQEIILVKDSESHNAQTKRFLM